MITLRALKLEDADTSYQWRADAEIRANILGFRLPVSREREREWVGRYRAQSGRGQSRIGNRVA